MTLGSWPTSRAWAAHQHCGDGVLDPDERCDDGNRLKGDGCSPTCRNEILSCGVPDPAASSCLDDAECGIGNLCDLSGCVPSSCGCVEFGEVFCTSDCGGTCVARTPIVCRDTSLPECQPRLRNPEVLCVDARGEAQPRPNGDDCWSDGDCGPKGLCVRPDCVASACYCSPGSGWSCTEDCGGGEPGMGLECRYPGDLLPENHPRCVEKNGASSKRESCLYVEDAESSNSAPGLGGFEWMLGLGLLGLFWCQSSKVR